MADETVTREGAGAVAALETAATIVDRWGARNEEFTGRWVDGRSKVVGVGIVDHGDDEAVQEFFQTRVPVGVRVRVRLVSAEWVRLHQLQVHVFDYLEDEQLWGRHAVSLGVDERAHHLEVGLLPSAPDLVAAQILERFPTDVALKRNATHAIAV